jgi:hypothetical protein
VAQAGTIRPDKQFPGAEGRGDERRADVEEQLDEIFARSYRLGSMT